MSSGRSLLSVIHEYMKLVMIPALAKTQWGQVETKQQREFKSGINSFVGFLESEHAVHPFIRFGWQGSCIHSFLQPFYPMFPVDAERSIESAVFFPLECSVDLDRLQTAEACSAGSKSAETVAALEGMATEWCHMVEQILAESGQMRREADDTGPLAELEYWKLRTAKFSGLIEQIKAHPMRSVFMVLHLAKSKVMKVCTSLITLT